MRATNEQEIKHEVVVREYEPEMDRAGAEAVDRLSDVSTSGGVSLFTDLLGDPTCRVRNSPSFLMLVAETRGPAEKEIVGVIRGCIKIISAGKTTSRATAADGAISEGVAGAAVPIYTKAAYILGLRVSPFHRRKGIGLNLVLRMEDWFRSNSVEYSYMATDRSNAASLSLFSRRLNYTKFRSARILVHPVFAHRLAVSRSFSLVPLPPLLAEPLYRRIFSTTEFFPRDIDAVLCNLLTLGTFLAVPRAQARVTIEGLLASPPQSWAVLSVWDCSALFRLELRGATRTVRGIAWATRAVDRAVPWLGIPSVPDIFRSFGGYFLYGIGGEGADATRMVRAMCRHVHNMARDGGCRVIATEVAAGERLLKGIPHWRRMSVEEDLWCLKRLAGEGGDGEGGDWTKAPPRNSIFVDPREV